MERRTHKRAPLDVIIYCRSSQAIVEGTAEDVSPGGILVKTAKTFPRNEKLDVFFKVPGSAQAIEAGVQGREVLLNAGEERDELVFDQAL